MYSDLNLICTKENNSQLAQINPGRFSVIWLSPSPLMICTICCSTSSLLIIAECNMPHLWGRWCSHTPASVLALTCLLIRNLTMTNQATQTDWVQLIPIRRQSNPRAAGGSSKETRRANITARAEVSPSSCVVVCVLRLRFIYLLRIIGPFHWHVAVPVRMEPVRMPVESFYRCALWCEATQRLSDSDQEL